jgi:hypothetical protein
LLLKHFQITFIDWRRLFIGPGYPVIWTSSSHLLQQPSSLDTLHRILWINMSLSDPMSEFDDPLFLRIPSRIVCRIGLEYRKRMIRKLSRSSSIHKTPRPICKNEVLLSDHSCSIKHDHLVLLHIAYVSEGKTHFNTSLMYRDVFPLFNLPYKACLNLSSSNFPVLSMRRALLVLHSMPGLARKLTPLTPRNHYRDYSRDRLYGIRYNTRRCPTGLERSRSLSVRSLIFLDWTHVFHIVCRS